VEILSAQANGLTLWLLAIWFGYEVVHLFLDPPETAPRSRAKRRGGGSAPSRRYNPTHAANGKPNVEDL